MDYGRSHRFGPFVYIFDSLKGTSFEACVMLVDDVYVTYIQFGFLIYVIYEFLKIYDLIHEKAKGLRRVKSLDAGR